MYDNTRPNHTTVFLDYSCNISSSTNESYTVMVPILTTGQDIMFEPMNSIICSGNGVCNLERSNLTYNVSSTRCLNVNGSGALEMSVKRDNLSYDHHYIILSQVVRKPPIDDQDQVYIFSNRSLSIDIVINVYSESDSIYLEFSQEWKLSANITIGWNLLSITYIYNEPPN